jgi:DNA-directed RNA polymerase specialized sigma24 family protein
MSPKIWLRHADPSERLDPRFQEAVELEVRKILPFRRDRLGDDIAAVEAIEEVVRSASKCAASIRNPRWYIFTSALRRLKRVVKRSPPISYVDPAKLETLVATNPYGEIDAKLLCEEIRAHLPEREFAFLMSVLMKDCTWEQLGAGMGLSADAARKKYDRLITSLREWLSKSGRPGRQ